MTGALLAFSATGRLGSSAGRGAERHGDSHPARGDRPRGDGRPGGHAPRVAVIDPSRHLLLHFFRNTIHLGSQYLWATSLLLLPLATVFALEFTTPAWTLLLAVPALGERMTASRIGAVVLGLLGVLVILRPGLATFQPAALLVLVCGVRAGRHPDRHQEADTDGQHVRDHLLDEPDPAAARPRSPPTRHS